jgi:di/tricarboxylate transporter
MQFLAFFDRFTCRRILAEKTTGDRYVALVFSPSVPSFADCRVTIVLWATSLLPEFMTALLFFAAAMMAKIAPPEVIFGGFASSAFWLVFSGFVLGIAIRKTGLADRAAQALSARLTDSWPLMVGSVVLLSYALAFVMPSNMGRIALLMPIVAAMAKRAGIADGTRAGMGWRWRWGLGPFSCRRPFCPPTSRTW